MSWFFPSPARSETWCSLRLRWRGKEIPDSRFGEDIARRTAVRDNNPVIFLENLALYNVKGDVPGGDYTIPLGQAKVTREGTDLTVISYSRMAAVALDVARHLEQENTLSVAVVDLRSLRPLDHGTIFNSVKKTGRAIVFEEDWRSLGIGAEVAATLQEEAFDFLDAPISAWQALRYPYPTPSLWRRRRSPVPGS